MADTEYATVAEFKAYTDRSTAGKDDQIQQTLNAAARAIDNYCNLNTNDADVEAFVALAAATAKSLVGKGVAYLRIPLCIAVTQVEVKGATEADTEYEALDSGDYMTMRGELTNPDFDGLPISTLLMDARGSYTVWPDGLSGVGKDRIAVPTVRVTAKWGYAETVPDAVKTATIAQAQRWMARHQSAFQDQSATADMGVMIFRKSLDPDIKMMLSRYRYEQV